MAVLGFDLGSHAAKGVIIDGEGKTLRSATRPHQTLVPAPGGQEQDAGLWWRSFVDIVAELTEGRAEASASIAAVGITGFVPALVALDAGGLLLRPAIMHTDTRSHEELRALNELLREPLHQGFLLPKILWLKGKEPDCYRRLGKILVPHSYLAYLLTGSMSCDLDTASIFGGLLAGESWDEGVCQTVGVDSSLLPPLFGAEQEIGRVTEAASAATGLPSGIPVIAGTGDSFASLLGCGAVEPGDLMVYLGTSATQILVEGDVAGFASSLHFGPGAASFVGRIVSCGDSLERFKRLLSFSDWRSADEAAAAVAPGSEGVAVFPHLKQKAGSDGSPLDWEAILGLEASHGGGHLFRSLLEGMAYNLRRGFEARSGDVRRVILSGGGARSPVFREILSAVLDRPVVYNPQGSGAAGIALLALCRESLASLRPSAAALSSVAQVGEAPRELVERYRALFQSHEALREGVDALHKLKYQQE